MLETVTGVRTVCTCPDAGSVKVEMWMTSSPRASRNRRKAAMVRSARWCSIHAEATGRLSVFNARR